MSCAGSLNCLFEMESILHEHEWLTAHPKPQEDTVPSLSWRNAALGNSSLFAMHSACAMPVARVGKCMRANFRLVAIVCPCHIMFEKSPCQEFV